MGAGRVIERGAADGRLRLKRRKQRREEYERRTEQKRQEEGKRRIGEGRGGKRRGKKKRKGGGLWDERGSQEGGSTNEKRTYGSARKVASVARTKSTSRDVAQLPPIRDPRHRDDAADRPGMSAKELEAQRVRARPQRNVRQAATRQRLPRRRPRLRGHVAQAARQATRRPPRARHRRARAVSSSRRHEELLGPCSARGHRAISSAEGAA